MPEVYTEICCASFCTFLCQSDLRVVEQTSGRMISERLSLSALGPLESEQAVQLMKQGVD